MKKCILLLILIIILSVSSCEMEPEEVKTMQVFVNNIDMTVHLSIYDPTVGNRVFNLTPGEKMEFFENCSVTETNAIQCDLLLRAADSLVLLFDQSRKLKYCNFSDEGCSEGLDRNIQLMPFYASDGEENFGWLTRVSGDTSVHTYTITQEDYQNAVPIGG